MVSPPGIRSPPFSSGVNNHAAGCASQRLMFSAPSCATPPLCAQLCYTSGTTGNPKGVLYSHRAQFLHALLLVQVGFAGFGAGLVKVLGAGGMIMQGLLLCSCRIGVHA